MGLLLFLLYINDIDVQVKTAKIYLFADDALLYCRVDDEFGQHIENIVKKSKPGIEISM